ncbi:MAG TPA: hypothetical protein VLH79_14410, partial [Chthonomonadales bacterium]|nr:hypothetical protein [Chthonomonadales bacterium]
MQNPHARRRFALPLRPLTTWVRALLFCSLAPGALAAPQGRDHAIRIVAAAPQPDGVRITVESGSSLWSLPAGERLDLFVDDRRVATSPRSPFRASWTLMHRAGRSARIDLYHTRRNGSVLLHSLTVDPLRLQAGVHAAPSLPVRPVERAPAVAPSAQPGAAPAQPSPTTDAAQARAPALLAEAAPPIDPAGTAPCPRRWASTGVVAMSMAGTGLALALADGSVATVDTRTGAVRSFRPDAPTGPARAVALGAGWVWWVDRSGQALWRWRPGETQGQRIALPDAVLTPSGTEVRSLLYARGRIWCVQPARALVVDPSSLQVTGFEGALSAEAAA